MSNAQTIKAAGLLTTLGIIALGMAFLEYLGRRLDPLFARAITRALMIGLVLLGVQIAGFMLSR